MQIEEIATSSYASFLWVTGKLLHGPTTQQICLHTGALRWSRPVDREWERLAAASCQFPWVHGEWRKPIRFSYIR